MDRRARDIFVISDLHLGDGGMRDNFEAGKKTPELRSFIEHVGSEDGELFILGDLFELWQMSLSRLLVKRRELLDQLATLPMIYVPGNHDVDLAHFIGTDFMAHPFFRHMHEPFFREIGGKRYRFFHGHEVDPFNAGDDPGFGRMLAIFGGIFEDQNGSPFLKNGETAEDVLEQFGDSMLTLWTTAMATMGRSRLGKEVAPAAALTPAQNADRLSEHVEEVRDDREKTGYDVAVLGHTHKPGRIGDWYLNSGSWNGPRNCFLRLSPDGHARYFEWKDAHPVEHAMPVIVADPLEPVTTPSTSVPTVPSTGATPIAAARAALKALFPRPKKPERSRVVLFAQGAAALAAGLATTTVGVTRGSSEGLRLLVLLFGIYALIDGVIALLGSTREPPLKRLLYRVRAVASLLLGLIVLRRGYVVEVFVILVGVWAFVSGAFRIAASAVLKRMVDSKWLFVVGCGSMLAGLALLLLPASTFLLKYALAGYLCYYGVGQLIAAVFGQRQRRRDETGGAAPVLAHT